MKKLILIIILFATCLFAQTIDGAKELFDNGQYDKAIEIFKNHEDKSDVQYYLGKAYLYGMGVEKDLKKAFNYATKSTDAKNSDGINLLAVLYANGDGVQKDEMQALIYYKEAAALGSIKAMMNIGEMYVTGSFVKEDVKQAIYWAKKAYENGSVRAIRVLGNLYSSTGTENYEEAVKYYNMYLNHKDADSSKIAFIYYKLGNICHDDYEKSIFYYKKSAKLGDDGAIARVYSHYMYKTYQFEKGIKIATSAYNQGNLEMGCHLSQYYSGLRGNYEQNPDLDYERAYTIATNIIKTNPSFEYNSGCYSALSGMYRIGAYLAQDYKKSIELLKTDYKYHNWQTTIPVNIANLYLEDLQDYENAQKWYEIAYDITKDKSYLTKVAEYKKSLPHFEDDNLSNVTQKVFPIVENFSKKEQVASVLESKEYYFVATGQKAIHMYDKKTLKLIKELRGWIGKGVEGVVLQMAYDEKNKLLYCAGIDSGVDLSKNNLIKVFDIETRKIVKIINNKGAYKNLYLNISDDGKYLVSNNNGPMLNIINTQNNEIQHYNFSNIINFKQVNIIQKNDDYLINALGIDNNLYTFSLNKKRQISKKKFINQTKFKTFNGNHAQKILKNTKSIENVFIYKNKLYIKSNTSNLLKEFDMQNLILLDTNKKINFENDVTSNILLQYKNNNTTVEVSKDNKLLSKIEFYHTPVLKHKILKNKYIILVTNDISAMYIFNIHGRAIAKLNGFQSIQTHMIYKDGYLITFGSDNIIHLWNIDNLDKFNTSDEKYDKEIFNGFNELFGGNPVEMLTDSDANIQKVLNLQAKQKNSQYIPTAKQFKSFVKMFLSKKEEILPLASLYIKDNEWVIYNSKGYFTSSKNGKQLIKYHLNQGLKKEAKIIKNEQIFDKFYRPDLIKKSLAKEKIDFDLDIRSVLQNTKAPELSIISKLFKKDNKNLDLIYKICDAGSGISNASLILNGISVNLQNSRGFTIKTEIPVAKNCTVYKNTITLKPGTNTLTLKAYDKDKIISDTSEEVNVEAKYKIAKKSNLHFISIAVSNYRDNALSLKYAVSDVKAVKEMIKTKSKDLFGQIYTYDLHDKDVSIENLEKLFDKISKEIGINDVFMLYIAGHGVTGIKDGLYYFLPHGIIDTSSNGLKQNAISINDIKHQLGKIKANKSLIFLDTCDSGSAIESIASRGLEQRMALERISYATGRNYIVASSKNQAALEGYKNHGVFTYAVLDSFSKAYFGNDKILTVTSLASFVEKEVPKITSEKFHYEQFPQKYLNGNDFPIGVR